MNLPHSGKEFFKTLRKMREELRAKPDEQSPISIPPSTASGFNPPKSEVKGLAYFLHKCCSIKKERKKT